MTSTDAKTGKQILAEMDARQAAADALQVEVVHQWPEDAVRTLRARAAAQVAEYPQYAGHHDRYELVRVTRDIRTKLGLAFKKGEVAIAAPDARGFLPGERYRTLWSLRNACDTSVPTGAVVAL